MSSGEPGPSDDTLPPGLTRRRVLVAVGDPALEAAVLGPLGAGPFEVRSTTGAGLVAAAEAFHPELVLLGEEPGGTTGRQAALALRAQGSTFALPIAAVLASPSVPTVMRWLAVGAVDVWQAPFQREVAARARLLIDECGLTRVQSAPVAERLLAFARRVVLSGTLTVYPGTPFEGSATFVDGTLAEAWLGPLRDAEALEQLVEHDDAPLEWVDASGQTQPLGLPPPAAQATRVLLVEAVPAVAAQLKGALERAGHRVEVASDGLAGLEAALRSTWDVAVIDLNLPGLDGWGFLRALGEDPVGRELAVLVLSAEGEVADTLRAARAGARAWLRKPGPARQLLDAVAHLGRPRTAAWQALAEKQAPVPLELRALGAVWTLRTLAELDCSGRLVVHDELSRFELELAQGQLNAVQGTLGSRLVTGRSALELLVGSRGSARFSPLPLTPAEGAPWIFDEVQAACDAAALAARRRLEEAVANPGALQVNAELAQLFSRVATAHQLEVLSALSRGPATFQALVEAARLPPAVVREGLVELVRRGVLTGGPLPERP